MIWWFLNILQKFLHSSWFLLLLRFFFFFFLEFYDSSPRKSSRPPQPNPRYMAVDVEQQGYHGDRGNMGMETGVSIAD
jgi:drug/metabolite transporter (DMT)-like permease